MEQIQLLFIIMSLCFVDIYPSHLHNEDITIPIMPSNEQSTSGTQLSSSHIGHGIVLTAHTINTTHVTKHEKHKPAAIPTPATCFDNDYDFYSCCIDGEGHGFTCWEGNRTSTLCCQSQDNIEWEYCDDAPQLLFDQMKVTPSPPIIGENITVSIVLNYSDTDTTVQNSGKIYVSVESPNNLKHNMNVLGNVSYNLCNISNSESNICPLKPGAQISVSFVVPGSIISNQSMSAGVFLARGSIWGDNNNLLGCLKILFELNSQVVPLVATELTQPYTSPK